jgi:predicted transcriptional regulator
MRNAQEDPLSRRERQIMDILYQKEQATAVEIEEAMPDAPTNAAVRAKLRVLEEKGHVRREEQGLRYVYFPVKARDSARRGALQRVITTFFEGSVERTVSALLDLSAAKLTPEDIDRIQQRIDRARKEAKR